MKFKQPKYNNKHSLNSKHNINILPNVNQYISIYFDDINSQDIYILFILIMQNIYIINNVQIQIQTNIVNENKTILESIRNIIQKDKM